MYIYSNSEVGKEPKRESCKHQNEASQEGHKEGQTHEGRKVCQSKRASGDHIKHIKIEHINRKTQTTEGNGKEANITNACNKNNMHAKA